MTALGVTTERLMIGGVGSQSIPGAASAGKGACFMTDEEKTALKVACVRAAATLMADPNKASIDVTGCVHIAARLYAHLRKVDWEAPA